MPELRQDRTTKDSTVKATKRAKRLTNPVVNRRWLLGTGTEAK